jgi:hypothetical protein
MSLPPAPVVALLRIIAHFIPHASLPRVLGGSISDDATWAKVSYVTFDILRCGGCKSNVREDAHPFRRSQ